MLKYLHIISIILEYIHVIRKNNHGRFLLSFQLTYFLMTHSKKIKRKILLRMVKKIKKSLSKNLERIPTSMSVSSLNVSKIRQGNLINSLKNLIIGW